MILPLILVDISALVAAEKGDEVVVVSKNKDLFESASSWAQGGIVYRGKHDSPDQLKKDMIKASDGMSNEKILDFFVKEAPIILKKILIDKIQVPFEKKNNQYIFIKEAAHSCKRIIFNKDNTGVIIIKKILEYLKKLKNISFLYSHMAIDLINIPHHSKDNLSIYQQSRCVGVYLYDILHKRVFNIFSDKIILATGGIGAVYLQNTNPPSATGDGIAIAYRAGARVINMEFTQFHPTTLAIKKSNNFLISEAVRGEGGILINLDGEEFMFKYDDRGSLASRDIVTRAIIKEQNHNGNDFVLLSLKNCTFDFKKRFPKIYKKCLSYDLNILSPDFKGIPITPAFHYSCGGIFINKYGETTIKNLFAIGEVSCSGIHGANRLASTSLLEGLFFAYQAAQAPITCFENFNHQSIKEWILDENDLIEVDSVMISQDFAILKMIMWNYVGVIRKKSYLSNALVELQFLKNRIEKRYRKSKIKKELLELRNATQVGILVANSAIKNKSSLGCHYLLD
jgi:L-aspartate oxidase